MMSGREQGRGATNGVLFAQGARRLPLSTIGLIQYISPSCQFLLGVLLYRERFTAAHATTFACIWGALALLAWALRARIGVADRANARLLGIARR